MNRAHRWYAISNEDMLYTLSAFVHEPIRWIDAYGWRPLLEQEKLAAFWFYRNVGERMNIQGIPSDYTQFEEFNREYERSRFATAPSGRRVADQALGVVGRWFPAPVRPVVRRVVVGLMDPPLRTAFGYREPRLLPYLVRGTLRARARVQRLGPARRRSYYDDPPKVRSYPGTQGDYGIADFG
nr:oxygenase MpaB family protein [Streptomyces sp. MST-110588]